MGHITFAPGPFPSATFRDRDRTAAEHGAGLRVPQPVIRSDLLVEARRARLVGEIAVFRIPFRSGVVQGPRPGPRTRIGSEGREDRPVGRLSGRRRAGYCPSGREGQET